MCKRIAAENVGGVQLIESVVFLRVKCSERAAEETIRLSSWKNNVFSFLLRLISHIVIPVV
jgi:hypothetical protein